MGQRPNSCSQRSEMKKVEQLNGADISPRDEEEVGQQPRGRGVAAHHRTSPAPHPEWCDTNWQPKNIPFNANPGPASKAAALESENPVDFVELFLSDELIQNIVIQTNLYAQQYIEAEQHVSPQARSHAWKPVTVSEMKRFLGLFFLTGIIRKPELEMYWSTDEMLATPYFNKVMSRNRFQMILRFLHFTDNEARPANNTDNLYKVRPVLDYLVSKFREMYQPSENICFDEGMLLWRGHLVFRVYNPQKPIKYGIKSYILCDSKTGYCFNLKPYHGEASALGDMIISLLDRLAGHGYKLFMDNYYNSISLCERLLDLDTHVCGTLRKNRGEPPVIQNMTKADLPVGETHATQWSKYPQYVVPQCLIGHVKDDELERAPDSFKLKAFSPI
ncbi:hypothetical protein ABVT39_016045 [Epinephelus coioides]